MSKRLPDQAEIDNEVEAKAIKKTKSAPSIRFQSKDILEIDSDETWETVLGKTANDMNFVTVVFLFATWSTPCKSIMTSYKTLLTNLLQRNRSQSEDLEDGPEIPEETAVFSSEQRNEPETCLPTATAKLTAEPTEKSSKDSLEIKRLKTITLRFCKCDKDKGPRSITRAKVPGYLIFRGDKLVSEIATRGKALEKALDRLEPI